MGTFTWEPVAVTAGHTAIVTGANRGIGAATAAALTRHGCAVLCTFLRVADQADPGTPRWRLTYQTRPLPRCCSTLPRSDSEAVPDRARFKGYITSQHTPACGAMWTTSPGNSGHPPATVPSYIAVTVTSHVTQDGETITGDTTHVVIVKTDPEHKMRG